MFVRKLGVSFLSALLLLSTAYAVRSWPPVFLQNTPLTPVPLPSSYYAKRQCEPKIPLPKATFSTDKLLDLALAKDGTFKTRTIDDLVPLLPEGLRKNVIALTKSGGGVAREGKLSLVGPETPRVILFDPSCRFRLSYIDCPKEQRHLPQCNTVEWQEFSPQGKLEFRRLALPGEGTNVAKVEGTDHKTEPTDCTGCHGDNAGNLRAPWEPYNFWNDVYGSLSRQGRNVVTVGSPEYKSYRAWVEKIWSEPEKHKRYTSLVWQGKNKAEILKYLDTPFKEPNDGYPRPGLRGVAHGEGDAVETFTDCNGLYDATRTVKAFTEGKDFDRNKAALFALLWDPRSARKENHVEGNRCFEKSEDFVEAFGGDAKKYDKWRGEIQASLKNDLAGPMKRQLQQNPGQDLSKGYSSYVPVDFTGNADLGMAVGLRFLQERLDRETLPLSPSRGQPWNFTQANQDQPRWLQYVATNVLTACEPELLDALTKASEISPDPTKTTEDTCSSFRRRVHALLYPDTPKEPPPAVPSKGEENEDH